MSECYLKKETSEEPLSYQLVRAESTNLRGSITVWLNSCLFCFKLAALLMLNEQQFYFFCQIQTGHADSQLYHDTSPYDECSLVVRVFPIKDSNLFSLVKDKFVKPDFRENEIFLSSGIF